MAPSNESSRKSEAQGSLSGSNPLNDELEQFLYFASHDLKEPLRKIIGYAQLLEKDLESGDDDRIQEDLHYIVDSAERMQALIDSLLELSRTGRREYDIGPIDPHSCLQKALDNLEFLIEENKVDIQYDDLPRVQATEEGLVHLYQNLTSNALKYNDSEPKQIHYTATKEKDEIVLGVKDNGIGIQPKYTEQIFEPFKRLQSREEYEGNGFGLALCQKIVHQMGGSIGVESEPGEGSHFQFALKEANDEKEDA